VRIAVATNLATTEENYQKLARDVDVSVRSVLARFEYVPVSALALLAQDGKVDVRLEVARNLNVDASILQGLLQDSDPSVAMVAIQALQRLHENSAQGK